jgi:hypothetical protein
MAVEKFIAGKHDSGHHEGKRSEMRRIDEAENEVLDMGEFKDVEYGYVRETGTPTVKGSQNVITQKSV